MGQTVIDLFPQSKKKETSRGTLLDQKKAPVDSVIVRGLLEHPKPMETPGISGENQVGVFI